MRIDIRQLHYIVDSDYIGDEPLQIAGGEEGVGENCVWAVVKSLKTSKGVKVSNNKGENAVLLSG